MVPCGDTVAEGGERSLAGTLFRIGYGYRHGGNPGLAHKSLTGRRKLSAEKFKAVNISAYEYNSKVSGYDARGQYVYSFCRR